MRRALLLLLAASLASACAARRPRPGVPPSPGTTEEGIASWYGVEEKGKRTSSGDIMDPDRFTAAHRSFPFGTLLRVTDVETARKVMVVVNDRGPFVPGRILDLSYGAANALGILEEGLARVRLQVIGSDPARLAVRWVVQVGAFLAEENARHLGEELKREGHHPIAVSRYDDGARVFYRVWVGEFTERAQAERAATRLRRHGLTAVVVQRAALVSP